MLNGIGVLLGGVFLGAVGVELVRRKYPKAVDKVSTKARDFTSGIGDAFRRGYEGADAPSAASD